MRIRGTKMSLLQSANHKINIHESINEAIITYNGNEIWVWDISLEFQVQVYVYNALVFTNQS
mgnify:CR=1 FL=1